MNKLQLYITKSFNGYKVLFNINPSEEITRHVRELRRAVEKVSYDASEKNIFFFVTTVDTGTFVAIIRTIPTEAVDHLAAWIYIPNELIIDGEALRAIVDTTTRKVSGDRVTQDDVAQLRELFSREYLTDPSAPAMTVSDMRGEVAWRAYNGETGVTLTDLLGRGLFQQAYLDYCGVMFVDADLGVTVDGPDLTELPLASPAVILPPEKSAENFSANIFGSALDTPRRGSLDCNLTVVWKRPGFQDVISEQVIDRAEFTPDVPVTSESLKSISATSFQITSQGGGSPEGCQILVNGIDVTNQPHLFTESELVSASVAISCEGCAPYTAHLDLAASTCALIRMQERTKVYCFEMPVKSADIGAPVRFKIYTKRNLDESPIEGYAALDTIQEGESRTNHLACGSGTASLMRKAIYAGAGFIAGVLISLCFTKCGGGEKTVAISDTVPPVAQQQTATTETPVTNITAFTAPASTKQETSTEPVAVTDKAIAYLDGNTTWARNEMEKYPELRGLFDDLNNFRYDKLTGEWATRLARSERYGKVLKHIDMGKHKPKRPQAESTTLTNGDKIAVQVFLNRVDP